MLLLLQEGQCDPAMELPAGATAGQENAPGALPTATEDLPGNAIHTRLDGRNQSESPVKTIGCTNHYLKYKNDLNQI